MAALLGGLVATSLLALAAPATADLPPPMPPPMPSPMPSPMPPSKPASPLASGIPPVRPDLPVALIADHIDYDTRNGRVIASGNVEVYYGERTLTAERIVYDSRAETITAEGAIVMRDPSGVTVFADFAELGTDLQTGLVRGAKAVMGEHIRLSAVEARRVEGRFNALSKAVYSPCKVCPEHPTPLWRIRARRVIHDEVEKRIHYENATLDVFGVPVLWLPWLSHPDPTVDRASGFLVPEFRQSSTYGFGVQVPYYWVIDDHADLTFTPFLTTNDGPIGIVEYRRAFADGNLRTEASLTYGDYTGRDRLHGHIEGHGDFGLVHDFRWGFDAIAVTDDGYLARFDFSDEDRLTSELWLRRYRKSGFLDLTGVYFRSLREDEPADQIPLVVPDFDARQELPGALLGGDLGLFASSAVLLRQQGLDANRVSVGVDWERREVLPSGLVLKGFAELRGDMFVTDDFGAFERATEFRFAPLAGIEARFPLISETAGGTAHVIAPVAQAIVAPYGLNPDEIPNEDSRVVEFDETNLFDTSRFPGFDAIEEGPRLNLGLRYELLGHGPLGLDASLGRVLRPRGLDEFSSGSGLRDAASDWVGTWSVRYDPYVTVRQRLRLGDGLSLTRNEIDAEFAYRRASLGLGYIFLERDPAIEAPRDREELIARAGLGLNRNWTLSALLRHDLENAKVVEAGGGLAFENECCRVELFIKRRATDRRDAPESTTVGLQVRLFTLGNNDYTGP
ncbi:MAG TPA: LPS assembly protein LptD [Thermohalobaculum sp.]|nr:LPS assembly protein LptD [Thermohalobaculum sp.]